MRGDRGVVQIGDEANQRVAGGIRRLAHDDVADHHLKGVEPDLAPVAVVSTIVSGAITR